MSILKHYKKSGYVQISNILAQTQKISYEALGVLINLLSRPENWIIHKSTFKNEHCGDVVINRIFKELRNAGYLFLYDIRESGKIKDRVWIISEDPIKSKEKWIEIAGNLNDGNAQISDPQVDKIDTVQTNNNTNKEKAKKERNIYTANFLAVWEIYPHGLTQDKEQAWKNWLTAITRRGYSEDDLLLAAKNYAKFCSILNRAREYRTLCSNFYGRKAEFKKFINYDFTQLEREKDNEQSRKKSYSPKSPLDIYGCPDWPEDISAI
jgi:hypothetical protein